MVSLNGEFLYFCGHATDFIVRDVIDNDMKNERMLKKNFKFLILFSGSFS